jgi:AcrR family transcriptional regulator
VFSLFGSKRELFLAAVERGFELVAEMFTRAAAEFDPRSAPPDTDVTHAMGDAYVELLKSNRGYLMLTGGLDAAIGAIDPATRMAWWSGRWIARRRQGRT